MTMHLGIIRANARRLQFLKDYTSFFHEDGVPYEGGGKPLTELVEPTRPAVPFNGVRNEPYFVETRVQRGRQDKVIENTRTLQGSSALKTR